MDPNNLNLDIQAGATISILITAALTKEGKWTNQIGSVYLQSKTKNNEYTIIDKQQHFHNTITFRGLNGNTIIFNNIKNVKTTTQSHTVAMFITSTKQSDGKFINRKVSEVYYKIVNNESIVEVYSLPIHLVNTVIMSGVYNYRVIDVKPAGIHVKQITTTEKIKNNKRITVFKDLPDTVLPHGTYGKKPDITYANGKYTK